MSEKFRVKYGLQVGDNTNADAMLVDGATGNITTDGDIDVKGGDVKNTTGALALSTGSNGNIDLSPNGTGIVSVNSAFDVNGNITGDLLQIDNININGNTISSTDTNGNLTLTPDGTGDVILSADTVQVGDSGAAATVTTNGNAQLTVSSQGSNNVVIDPGSGTTLNDGHMILGQANTNAILTTNGTGNLDIRTGSHPTGPNITLTDGTNGNITLTPHGTGKVIISSDLQVDGTTTTINSTTLDVDDKNITLAKGAANAAAADGGGITLEGPATPATLLYEDTDDSWNFNKKTAAPELQVDNININGNTVSSTDTNGNVVVDPNGTGAVHLVADTTQLGTGSANATLTTSGAYDLTLNTNNGSSSGSIAIADGANGNITITPNGTGDLALSLSNGGNLTNTRNYVFGAIRNSTTDSNGDIWVLDADSGGAGTLPVRGISIDNSSDTTKNAGVVVRNYNNTTATFAPRIVFERARGTAASPATLSSGDVIGIVSGTGYSSTLGWINDTLPFAPALMSFSAAEAWSSNTNLGTAFNVITAPSATTISTTANLITTITHNPQSATYRSDAFTFRQGKTGTTNLLTLGTGTSNLSSDVITLEKSDGTDLAIFQSSSAAIKADTFTFEKSNGTDMVTIDSNGNFKIYDPSGYSRDNLSYQPKTAGGNDSLLAMNQVTNSANDFPQFSFFNYRSTDGTNFTPTQSGDVIGGYKFNGNAVSSTTPSVPGGPAAQITCSATENWSNTANGSQFVFSVMKKGTITNYDALVLANDQSYLRADNIKIQDSSGTDYLTLDSNEIKTNKTFKNVVTDAGNFAGGSTYTPAATITNAVQATINSGTGGFTIDLTNLDADSTEGGFYMFSVINSSGSAQQVDTTNGAINASHNLSNGNKMLVKVYVVGTNAYAEHLA